MARNWKKAHDALKARNAELETELATLRFDHASARSCAISRGKKLDIARDLLLGAAENFDAHKIAASARSIRHAVNSLNWLPTSSTES